MSLRAPSRDVSITHEPVLGTVLHVRLTMAWRADARVAERAMLSEIDRLERVFSAYETTSELCRWRSGLAEAGPELSALLARALRWQELAGGAFNPAVGLLTDRWRAAQRDGAVPDEAELLALASTIRTPRYRVVDGRAQLVDDGSCLTLNAFAKGHIVDAALRSAMACRGVLAVVVNIGGDLAHAGRGRTVVGVEDPLRAYDNAAPIASVAIANMAIATSGSGHRGFDVGGRWFSHVIDPRTGWPVDHVSSASVIARDASTADVAATVLSVLPPHEGLAALSAPVTDDDLGCCVIDADGVMRTNAAWDARVRVSESRASR